MARPAPGYPLPLDSDLSLWLAVDPTVDLDALRAEGRSEDEIVLVYHPARLELIREEGRATWAEQVAYARWMAWRAEQWLACGIDPTGGRTPPSSASPDEGDCSGSTADRESPEPTISYPCWAF